MTKFTKEQLIARINQVAAINKYRISREPDADGLVMDNELFTIALAALTAEPVAWISERNLKNLGKSYSVYVKHEPVMVRPIPLYTAPPILVVQDEVRDAINCLLDSDGSRGTFNAVRSYDAREELERLLSAAPQEEDSQIKK